MTKQGVEMVIDEASRPPARVLENFHDMAPPSTPETKPKKKTKSAATAATVITPEQKCDGPVRVGMPGKFDVLCGQSRICASHTGNRRFQVVLDIFAHRYELATSKQEKMSMTKEIVNCIHQAGGRFLKYKANLWPFIFANPMAVFSPKDIISKGNRKVSTGTNVETYLQEADILFYLLRHVSRKHCCSWWEAIRHWILHD